MSTSFDSSIPADITLLLRADAEHSWLHREVMPVLRQVERPEQLPAEEVGPALAYLEAMWCEAAARGRAADAARGHLHAREAACEPLATPAGRYHAAVQALRRIVAERVTPFVDPQLQIAGARQVRVTDTRHNGCAPRAA